MKNKNKKILIICGDPNSINSEIIYKSWKKLNNTTKKNIYLIGSYSLIKSQLKRLKYSKSVKLVKNLNESFKQNNLKILDVDLKFKDPFNVNKKESSNYVLKCLERGHRLALQNKVSGLINCAINKELLIEKKIGVTELLARKCKVKNNSEVMVIRNKSFSVSPITTHADIKDVEKKINKKILISKLMTIQKFYLNIFNKKPKICLLGLNPHNAELRKNSKEVNVIIPSIKKLKKLGLKVEGPKVADTIFIKDYKEYDLIVGMYHDQVLAPFKAIYKFDAINITLGLKYLRVSPDHGVAKDIIKKNKGNPISLLECIKFINKFGK